MIATTGKSVENDPRYRDLPFHRAVPMEELPPVLTIETMGGATVRPEDGTLEMRQYLTAGWLSFFAILGITIAIDAGILHFLVPQGMSDNHLLALCMMVGVTTIVIFVGLFYAWSRILDHVAKRLPAALRLDRHNGVISIRNPGKPEVSARWCDVRPYCVSHEMASSARYGANTTTGYLLCLYVEDDDSAFGYRDIYTLSCYSQDAVISMWHFFNRFMTGEEDD